MQSRNFKQDLLASLVVFIVALPLSLGIAMASGVSPVAGLLTAIIGGVICGMLSGAPLVVAGPAAGMVAIVFPLVQKYGLQGLAIITVVAGATQLIMGTLRLGFIFTYVPKVVLEGMLSAIGFTIALYQMHVLFGSGAPDGIKSAILNLPSVASNAHMGLIICGVLALGIQIAWPYMPKQIKWLPGALPAVLAATFLSLAWEMPRVEIGNFISQVQSAFSTFSLAPIQQYGPALILAGITVAIVASAESLLTAIAIDGLNKAADKTPTNLNKELLAHGFSNATSGLLGGIPLTGVIVRSAVNINSGAKTRLSTILHGLWIALFVIFLPGVLQYIPLTALAAVLVYTGVKLLNVGGFLQNWKTSKLDAAKWAITMVGILAIDLLGGLALGIAVSFIIEKVLSPKMRTSAA